LLVSCLLPQFNPLLGFEVLGLGRLGLWSTSFGARAAASEFVCAAMDRFKFIWTRTYIMDKSIIRRTTMMLFIPGQCYDDMMTMIW